ncbi:HIRAN domain-containing protein [Prevotella communis]|uniref:HIRAN domain-containing protein n=1 Tax=Prevotella communis TaxID=2913614 RepID=UPI001EDA6FF1|nr:HIRAN domain-containing protein [Prevotella communis]UKK68263.1 HIRAN domain-containing protein [Prevotella communis]UKK69602.1 HIRAN domain-containing protein [Prevotella communis]
MFRIHIVALPYYEVKECLGEFLAEAMGRAMTLRPDPANDVDAKAICAYDWEGRHAGYVAAYDLREAWQTLRGSGRKSLRGRIVEVNGEHKCLVFECKVETLGESCELYPTAAYTAWNYTGPRLKSTHEMVTLDYMMDEICERLDEHELWSDEEHRDFLTLTMRFCELSCYDLSGEMSDFRRRLCLRLMEIDDYGFQELTEELKMACGRAGRESHGGKVLNYWMRLIAEPKTIKPLLVCRHEHNIDEIKRQLECFPESMFEEWIENKENFVAKLLYMHIPREVLWRFISGIAFYEAVSARQKSESTSAAENEKTPQNVNVHVELFSNKDTNIDKNFGPNIEHNGGTLSLPNKNIE